MAAKQTVRAVHASATLHQEVETIDMRIEIKGMSHVPDQPGLFILENVNVKPFDSDGLIALTDMMRNFGLNDQETEEGAELVMRFMHGKVLSRFLAERLSVVGFTPSVAVRDGVGRLWDSK